MLRNLNTYITIHHWDWYKMCCYDIVLFLVPACLNTCSVFNRYQTKSGGVLLQYTTLIFYPYINVFGWHFYFNLSMSHHPCHWVFYLHLWPTFISHLKSVSLMWNFRLLDLRCHLGIPYNRQDFLNPKNMDLQPWLVAPHGPLAVCSSDWGRSTGSSRRTGASLQVEAP